MYIYCFILSLILIVGGAVVIKKPVEYNPQRGEWEYYDVRRGHRPFYESKRASSNEVMWGIAQRIYGKLCLIGGCCYLILMLFLIPLFEYVCYQLWKKEDVTIPFLVVITCPFFGIILLIRMCVENRLKAYERI